MERRKALAAASAATLVLGTGIIASIAVAGVSILGFGGGAAHAADAPGAATTSGAAAAHVVVRTRNVYDREVVETGANSTTQETSEPASDVTPVVAAPALGVGATSTSVPSARSHPPLPPTTAPPHAAASTSTTSTPTTASPTTVPQTTTTTRPRGVPPDWPPGTPIPPVPPDCREQHLGLDGVWHCDD